MERAQKKQFNKYIFVIITLVIALFGTIFFCLYSSQKSQNKIEVLENKIEVLEQSISDNVKVAYKEDTFNYLAIGNSVLISYPCDYWWNTCGMAATEPEKDYFHLVENYLTAEYEEVTSYPYNFYQWELMDHDRNEALGILNPYLDEKLDLVTIQLSENVFVLDTFEEDLKNLIVFIREKAPKAKIILVDDIWSEEKAEIKKKTADELNILFADLSLIRNNPEYQCGLGTEVLGDDGLLHMVEHEGVSHHPGDKGMEYTSNQIISCILQP